MMPAWRAAAFQVIQAERALEFAVIVLDGLIRSYVAVRCLIPLVARGIGVFREVGVLAT
jgi:hypothetical protein